MIAGIMAGILNAVLAILGKVATQAFFEAVIGKVVVAGLRHLAKMSTNDIDDKVVEDVAKQLGYDK